MEPLNLSKGQELNLEKHAGRPLKRVDFGLGWDAAAEGRSIDLDASAILLDADNKEVGVVYFQNLQQYGVKHSGDNLTGAGDGDDEVISVDCESLDAKVQTIVFIVNSYSGQRFDQVANIGVNIYDGESKDKLASYTNSELGDHTGIYVGALRRTTEGFTFRAIGELGRVSSINDMRGRAAQLATA